MRKKRLMIAIACIILVGIAVIVFFSQQGKKPYKDLDAAQIVSAKVLLTPPDKTIEIENIQELVEYLNDVVVSTKKPCLIKAGLFCFLAVRIFNNWFIYNIKSCQGLLEA